MYFHTYNIRCVGQRAAKILPVKVGGKKKVCRSASASLAPVGPGLTPTSFELFSKFNARQLSSPLTYKPYIIQGLRCHGFEGFAT